MALRKIAALNIDLLPDLLLAGSAAEQAARPVRAEWTEEARVMMLAALAEMDKDPKRAAQIAQQSLPLGIGYDYSVFLEVLARRDAEQAERLAIVLMDRLRDSATNPLHLVDLGRFVFGQGRSDKLKEHFFGSAAVLLKRGTHPDVPTVELAGTLSAARRLRQLARSNSPAWQPEFDGVVSAIEALFRARHQPLPGPSRRITIEAPLPSEATSGDTDEIARAATRVENLRDSKTRDREYENLATRAAVNADETLAELLMSKIADDELRRATSFRVYSPLAKKAIKESLWSQAQRYALKIQEPLGRTLVLDAVAQAMSAAGEDKVLVIALYGYALERLEHDERSANVARALLTVAKTLLPLDKAGAVRALNSACRTLDQLAAEDGLFEMSSLSPAYSAWVKSPNSYTEVDERIELTEMMSAALSDIAKQDTSEAMFAAAGLKHEGLRALAVLAVSRALFDLARKAPSNRQD